MGLGDFTPDDSSSGGSGKEYYNISRDEFEEFLEDNYVFSKVYEPDSQNFSVEIVYSVKGHKKEGSEKAEENLPEDLEVRVYSGIDSRTGESREKGKDAIRTVLWSKSMSRPVGGRTRTHRIRTWRKNLRKKVDSLLSETEEYVHKCPECGGYMVKRDGKFGEFLGCLNYPDCDHTEQIE